MKWRVSGQQVDQKKLAHMHARMHTHTCTYAHTRTHAHTHTHTQPFYGSLDFVQDKPGELLPEETFTHSHLS